MRLFIGLELPQELRQRIYDFLSPLQTAPKGWEKVHDYHQTLLFIGEVDEPQRLQIQERLRQLTFTPFELTTTEFRFFSRRIMYLGLEPSRDLTGLKNKVVGLFPEWINPHSKPFTPHVTVKRWQRYEHEQLVSGIREKKFPPLKFTVTTVCLFMAEKDPAGNKYHVILRTFE